MKLADALAIAPRPRRRSRQIEDGIQAGIVDWLRLVLDPRLYRVFSVPNGGARNKAEAAKLKATGVLAGVFDIEIAGPGGRVWRLETKTEDGVLSDAQEAFRLFLIIGGSPYAVVRSLADVEKAIAHWQLKTRIARAA